MQSVGDRHDREGCSEWEGVAIMQVAKIISISGRTFYTNDTAEESLNKLSGVESIEIIEMEPEEFWRIPATNESVEFFSSISGGTV